ncbi:unnamed protein product, partial [Allacma fusca]
SQETNSPIIIASSTIHNSTVVVHESTARSARSGSRTNPFLRTLKEQPGSDHGSTITIRYHEPRQIIKLPFDLTPLTEEEKAIHLQRRKPKTRVKIVEDSEKVEFDSKKYRKYMKKDITKPVSLEKLLFPSCPATIKDFHESRLFEKMTESSLSTRAHFTLGQELPVSLMVSSSDELEEEPLTKRIKIDESNDPPKPAFPSENNLDFDLLKEDDTYDPEHLLGSTLNPDDPSGDSKVPSHPSEDSASEGGEISSSEEVKSKSVSGLDTNVTGLETTKENEGNPSETTRKYKSKTKSRKRRKSKLEPKDDPELQNSTSDEEDEDRGDHTTTGQSEKSKKRNRPSHLRKNIREILSTNQLDEETLAAQREEQERRARVSLKLAQQQQQNLVQMLNTATPSNHPFQLSQQIDKLFARKGVMPAPGLIPIVSSSKKVTPPTVIDEVVLSSDEENPDIIPLEEGIQRPDIFRGLDLDRRNGFSGFRNSGGTMQHVDGAEPLDAQEDVKVAMGEESDSDDCVVLSPSAYHDEIDKEGKEDENNFPDELGRVLVNVAHPPDDPDIFLAPQIARAVKPHQIGGIRFLYDNVIESLDRFNTSNGFGCILAHSMGLGKTIQAVSFCDIFLRHTHSKTVLIIVPINTIQNWLNEFDFWVPPDETVAGSSFKLRYEKKLKGRKGNGKNTKSMSQDSPSQPKLEQPSSSAPSPVQINAMPGEPEEENSRITNSDESSATTSSSSDVRPRKFQVFVLNETVKTLGAREKIISEWSCQGGVLLLGYEMYRMLALKKLKRSSKKKLASLSLHDGTDVGRAEEQSLERIYEHLVRPGPDLVICDEGHRIKNSGASISQALKAVRTRRRVVLTGYPLQNNLMEYWCMVDFVRPNYLGSKTEFSNMFERPITNGQCTDSSMSDRKLMRYRSHVLHTLLEGFVQRRSHQVLQSALPFKEEWVFLLKMTPIQYTLYKEFIRYLREEHRDKNADKDGSPTANPIKAFAVCCKIWNHPDALYNVVKKQEDVLDDLDMDDIDGSEDGRKKRKPRGTANNKNRNLTVSTIASPTRTIPDFNFNNFNAEILGLGIASAANIPSTVGQQSLPNNLDGRSISLEWASAVFKNYESELLENGVKFQLLFAIVEEIQKVGDKLLVFSQSLLTLDLIELFLGKKFGWRKNSHYFRLDGSTSGLEREKLIYDFNDNENIHLFLVSTRAGSLGINLIGANRVVVFDASWNPCHDAQAVCRVYRYGQKKECQIYRFVTDCTLEKRIYDRQINKRGMSDRVVDEMNPEAHLQTKDVTSFLVLDQAQMDEAQNTDVRHNFDMGKFTDPVLRTVLNRCGDRLTREPFEHESLLIDRKESKLSAKEKRIARLNYEEEKKQSGNSYSRPSYSAFYPKPMDSASLSQSNSSYSSNFPLSYNNFAHFSDTDRIRMMNTSTMSYREKMLELHQIQQKRLQQHADLPYDILKERGIDVRFMNLKKDAYLIDPQSGREMYLKAGEKISILRSPQGTYLRIGANGSLIGIKPTSANSNSYRGIPLVGDVSTTQLQALVYSLLRPAKQTSFYNPYVDSNSRNPVATEISPYFNRRSGFDANKPPPMQKLPPTSGLFPSFHNHQITNFRSNSGGDVTILRGGAKSLPPPKYPSPRQNSSNNNSDVEIIEFDEHFGEVSSTRGEETSTKNVVSSEKSMENLRSLNIVSRKDSSSSRQSPSFSDSVCRNRVSGPPTPDISIVPIPASPSGKASFLSHLDTPIDGRPKSVIRSGNNSTGPKSGSGSNDNSNSNSNLSWEHSSGSDLSTNLSTPISNINPPEDNPDATLWASPENTPGITPSASGLTPGASPSLDTSFLDEALPAWANSSSPNAMRASRPFLDTRLAPDLIQNTAFKTRDVQFPPNSEIYGHFFDDINNTEGASGTTSNYNDFFGAGAAGGNGLSPVSHVPGSQNNGSSSNLMMNPVDLLSILNKLVSISSVYFIGTTETYL